MEKKTSIYENSLIWFGAGVSIAEILTGTYYASMDFKSAILAIIIGHIAGFILMSLSGLIGARTGLSAMEATKLSFGRLGGIFFAILNFLQLVGWTAIMIYDGAISSGELFGRGNNIWALLIGILIIIWIAVGITNLGKINTVSMVALFVLTILMSRKAFTSSLITKASSEALSFGGAVELAIAMPMSWLPLISDYTSEAEKPEKATWISVGIYSLVSMWMYIIGLTGAMATGESTLSAIFSYSGIGSLAIIIIILSTVTTTFLDAYSAGISFESIKQNADGKKVAIIVSVVGIILAIVFPMDDITNFLYLIGSVFAPMIAVQIGDFFLKNEKSKVDEKVNIISWVFGFIIYRILLKLDVAIGASILSVILTIIVTLILRKIISRK
ncbi:Cytosine permease [Anaerococcus prevotii]|uniref:Hydroxymethylpyrimidine transporter CytX n=1 Tax=Anaerococcus prevotii (strain ATCC 9321 / DSM 20548 / JCM 6508 / NCTC 11806 / PC1) TaxID=525919 RepID=C7RE06_ANAPD|nr:putative hydroxymethylpyrimidine transporter CytX [Anaerococcus prevotii]ACV29419.1 hydroxymethylpyrimidine transporter CytX [Anaerococcus prevotii DSM 20548]SUU95091.1 Cytosine permease [Anaerococcus prevotii]